jgi:hypothetical protein
MSRRWENSEVPGRGTRHCLVIDPEDGTHPIRTYGWSQEEVLDKVAHTAETAQAMINRQRQQLARPAAPSAPAAAAPAPKTVSAEEQLEATRDLTNPAKAPAAVKTLLRAAGVDVDKQRMKEDAEAAGDVAQEWERRNPEFPGSDRRNLQMMMDKALILAGGRLNQITLAIMDQAYRALLADDMFHLDGGTPPTDNTETSHPSDATNGNSYSRGGHRTATSYRRTALTSVPPGAKPKPAKYTREYVEGLNSKQYRDAIERDPELKAFVDALPA